MGIYNRDYYREWRSAREGSWGFDGLTPVVKGLILANVAVFIAQILIVRQGHMSPLEMMRRQNPELDRILSQKEAEGPEAVEEFKKKHPELYQVGSDDDFDGLVPNQRTSIVQEWLELDTKKVVYQGQVWRLLTHAFCHDRYGLFHILFNMLCLYWFGGSLEMMYGGREFLLFYLCGAVVAGLTLVGLDLYTGSSVPAIGASGAVMAVMMLYTMHFPRETICLFWFFPLEMRWVMLFYLVWDLHPVLLSLSGERMFTGIGHAAHLGGLAFGFTYAKGEWRLEDLLERIPRLTWHWQRRPQIRLAPETVPEPEPPLNPEMWKVDELLQKILESGECSLSEQEKIILRNASERMKQRQHPDGA